MLVIQNAYSMRTHILLHRRQDCTQTNTGKYIIVSRDEYKLHDLSITQIFNRPPPSHQPKVIFMSICIDNFIKYVCIIQIYNIR